MNDDGFEEAIAAIAVEQEADSTRLVLSGEFDAHTVPRLDDDVTALLDEPPRDLVVDMSEVAFIDSTGLAFLVKLYTHVVVEAGGTMRIERPTSAAHRLLEICGLLETFSVNGGTTATG
jgi:anti-anti-sigma factor